MEVEAFAIAVLVAQMQNAMLDDAPVWTDARTFDGRTWRGAVDCVLAGFPCQDISSAGKRAGIRHGKRSGLWYSVARIIREVRPRYVFLENVDDITVRGRGLDIVLGDMAEMGFAAAWGVFSAAEVGAPHLRERWFCLGVNEWLETASPPGKSSSHLANAERDGWRESVGDIRRWQPESARRGAQMGEPICAGLEGFDTDRSRLAGRLAAVGPAGSVVADADEDGLGEQRSVVVSNDGEASRWDDVDGRERPSTILADFPPGPSDVLAWRSVPASLEPAICRLVDELDVPNRIDWLRLLGNGVVPKQAEHAYRTLRGRLMAEGLWP